MGIAAACSLIIYTLTLGAVGDLFALPRRIGVIGYFAFTAFSHLIILQTLSTMAHTYITKRMAFQVLYICCIGLVLLGGVSALLGFFWQSYTHWDNAFEWWFAALLMAQFAAIGVLVRPVATHT